MPVIAYLDTGIYCHPIVDGLVDAVKVGYYNPPDMPRERARRSTASRTSSSSACPGCATPTVSDVEDVDQCDYDLVADDDFVLGADPGRSPAPSSASDGEAPATSSRRGWGGCSPSCALQGGTVYDIAPLRSRPFRSAREPIDDAVRRTRTLQQRLAEGVVLGAEGYVFELERRGYVKAGPYVPEVILDAPDALRQLHREFLRAGSDVMVALTYYAHRDKLARRRARAASSRS